VARDHGHQTIGCAHGAASLQRRNTRAHDAGAGTHLHARCIAATGFADAPAIAATTTVTALRNQSRGGFATMVHHYDRR
jgi:hypothetical protein